MTRLSIYVLALFVVVGCFCRPQGDDVRAAKKDDGTTMQVSTTPNNRMGRLQKPTQVLNTGFDEIVVESNLQVHNRVGSKNKSKIMLPSNSTASTSSQSNKSGRALVV